MRKQCPSPQRRPTRGLTIALVAVAVVGSGCKGEWTFFDRPAGAPCVANPPTGVDPTAGVSFDPEHVPCVEVQMDPDDWEALQADSRFPAGQDYASVQCGEPWPNEYDWFEADIAVDGVSLDRVGIRMKGFVGSQFADVPALKVKTDRFVDGQLLGDTERITLNNNSGDPTHMASCLSFEVFAAAGYPAPLCNLAGVTVNGEVLGPYTHVEAIKKRFLRRAFGDDSGSLYEGTGADLGDDWLGRWEVKTADTDPSRAPLVGVIDAMAASDDELLDSLEAVLDVDRYITFWALEVLVNHLDGHAADRNNVYVYFDPTDGGRAVFVPWGIDKSFAYDSELDGFLTADLPRRLSRLPESRGRFEDELARLVADVWDTDVLLASVDRYEAQANAVQQASDSYGEAVATLRVWIEDRPAQIEAMLAGGAPQGAAEPLSCDGGAEGPGKGCSAVGGARPSGWALVACVGLIAALGPTRRRSPGS